MFSPLPRGMGDAYDVCGASMCPWDMEGGVGAHWGPPVLSSLVSERIQRSEKGGEAGSDFGGFYYHNVSVIFQPFVLIVNVSATVSWLAILR